MKHPSGSDAKHVYGAPWGFFVIGMALGMVVMVILFKHFEPAIKSWAGYKGGAYLLLVVYSGITAVLWFKFRRNFRQLIDRE